MKLDFDTKEYLNEIKKNKSEYLTVYGQENQSLAGSKKVDLKILKQMEVKLDGFKAYKFLNQSSKSDNNSSGSRFNIFLSKFPNDSAGSLIPKENSLLYYYFAQKP